ncbi:hypothetical protein, partial [Vibrio harveyi]
SIDMLLKCVVCEHPVAPDADRCPNCRTGDPFGAIARRKRLEKWLAFIVLGGSGVYFVFEFIQRGYLQYFL